MLRLILTAAAMALAVRAYAQCCGDPNVPDVLDRGGLSFDDSFGLRGRVTREEAEHFTTLLSTVSDAVGKSLDRHGLHKCRRNSLDPIAEGNRWWLTPYGRVPQFWSMTFDCGRGALFFLHLCEGPCRIPEARDYQATRQGPHFVSLVSRDESTVSPDVLRDREWKVFVGDISDTSLPSPPPVLARPRAFEFDNSNYPSDPALLLDTEEIADALRRIPDGPLMKPAPIDPETRLSEVERHVLERAVIATLLPEVPPHNVAVSTKLLAWNSPDDQLRAFLTADLGLQPSLVSDFLSRSARPGLLPGYLSVGSRSLGRDHAKPTISFSSIGFSSDHVHAMIFVKTDYPGNHWRESLLVFKSIRGKWVIEYSRGRIIC